MTCLHRAIVVLFVLGAAALAPLAPASAQFTVGPIANQVGGEIYIGTRLDTGRGTVAFQPANGGACTFWVIGFSINGGLLEYVNVIGSKKGDIISFPTLNGGPNQLCGHTWGPLITNGHPIEVASDDGNDTLINVSVPNVFLDGGRGNDQILNFPSVDPDTRSRGYTGNDVFFSDAGDYLEGQDGDDLFCMGGRASHVNGGAGFDRMCGDTADTVLGIQETNCMCF
jgi:hypothetical protein